jgi:hypothetical protein
MTADGEQSILMAVTDRNMSLSNLTSTQHLIQNVLIPFHLSQRYAPLDQLGDILNIQHSTLMFFGDISIECPLIFDNSLLWC